MNRKPSLLIVRSVSFQHLDWVLSEVKARWPDCFVTLLTHAHGLSAARQTVRVDEVLVYPRSGDFSFWGLGAKFFSGRSYDHVLVPFSNCSGAGFDNVVAMAFRIPARNRWTLPLGGEAGGLGLGWWFRFPVVLLLKLLALSGAILGLTVVLPVLAWRLLRSASLGRRGRTGPVSDL
jgi:hypothetical protein